MAVARGPGNIGQTVSHRAGGSAQKSKVAGMVRQQKAQALIRKLRANRAYLALVTEYPIHPIRSAEDLDLAIEVVDGLLSRPRSLDPQEQDYLDSLSHEIERYEAMAHPMPAVSDAAMLRHLIDAKGVTLSEASTQTGIAISTLSAVMNGKRKLNRDHLQKLAPYFGVQPGVFLD
jgi:HTH-type transcriptional regulator/antitoxin HigA